MKAIFLLKAKHGISVVVGVKGASIALLYPTRYNPVAGGRDGNIPIGFPPTQILGKFPTILATSPSSSPLDLDSVVINSFGFK